MLTDLASGYTNPDPNTIEEDGRGWNGYRPESMSWLALSYGLINNSQTIEYWLPNDGVSYFTNKFALKTSSNTMGLG